MLLTAPALWPPQGAATHAPGAPRGRAGGYRQPLHLPHRVRCLGSLMALMVALLPHPAPSQVRALASVISNLFRDALPAPASPRQNGSGPAGLDPSTSAVSRGTGARQRASPRAAPLVAPERQCTSPQHGTKGARATERLATSPCPACQPLESSASAPLSSMPCSASLSPGCKC